MNHYQPNYKHPPLYFFNLSAKQKTFGAQWGQGPMHVFVHLGRAFIPFGAQWGAWPNACICTSGQGFYTFWCPMGGMAQCMYLYIWVGLLYLLVPNGGHGPMHVFVYLGRANLLVPNGVWLNVRV